MPMDNSFWQKVEGKTKVNKDTILDLARKLQNGNMKDENTLNQVIDTLASITGKAVSSEKRKIIIDKVVNDKAPNNWNVNKVIFESGGDRFLTNGSCAFLNKGPSNSSTYEIITDKWSFAS